MAPMGTSDVSALDRLLDPLARRLPREAARAIADYHVDPQTQALIDELANKCNEGKLTEEERQAYASYVEAIDLIAILQDKAREFLEDAPES
jgi:hypothetical protein